MIANITSGSYLKGLLAYNETKIKEEKASVFHLNNIVSDNSSVVAQSLFNLMQLNDNVKKKTFHVSLNFKKDDFIKLNDDEKKDLIKDYMTGLGFEASHPYIVYFHDDRHHPHFHIVTSKVQFNGKPIKDSFIKRKSQRISRKIEEKYNLSPVSSIKTDKLKDLEKKENLNEISEIIHSYDKGEIEQKQLLTNIINYILVTKKPINFKEFEKYLNKYNVNIYITKHKNKGIVYSIGSNIKGIKASNLDKQFTYKVLNKIFVKNKLESKEYKNFIAKKINFIFYKYDKITPDKFIEELKKAGIKANVNLTNGTIKGFSYEYKGYKFKGQDLPKRAYVFSKIKDKFIYQKDEIKLSSIYKLKFKYYKNLNNERYDIYKFDKFIKGLIISGIKPVIIDNKIHLTDIKNNGYLDKTNSFSIDLFQKEISQFNNKDLIEFDKTVERLIHENESQSIFNSNSNIDNFAKKVEFDKTSYIENIYDFLTNNIDDSEDYTENKNNKKRKKRRKKL